MDMASAQSDLLNGFDPLSEAAASSDDERGVFEQATKRIVQNILKSYTGYFDLFSELIQNSLDAVDAVKKSDAGHIGKLWIRIDMSRSTISVIDNGLGMGERELRYCFRPSVSFKNRKESRGHKGVGATFLAYGFTNIQVFTKKQQGQIAVQLSNGRAWAEDLNHSLPRPTLQSIEFNAPELNPEQSGTKIEINIGQGIRPVLNYWNAQNAEQWLSLLRVRTPLGGVYLTGRVPPAVNVHLTVVSSSGAVTEARSERVEYFWPHEMPSLTKTKSVSDIMKEVTRCDGDKDRLPPDFRNLSAIYEVWDQNALLDEGSNFRDRPFEEEDRRLIRQHDVSVYGCFLSSAKSWSQYQQDELKIRKSPLIIRGGMQIASDHMVQGDLNVIPLTSTIGYQANTHMVIHFRDGNPDMGRKVFQPEIKALAEKISIQAVNVFKRYLYLMREDTGAAPISDGSELWEWLVGQETNRKANPFDFAFNGSVCAYASVPMCEQDVVAVFHEIIGMGLIKGLKFLATSGTFRYDSCFKTFYDDRKTFEFGRTTNPLGVSSKSVIGKESKPFILEYKFDFDALIADLEKEIKYISEIDAVVCWDIGQLYKERFRFRSLLVGDEGSGRAIYGSTHALFQDREKRLEVICLSDLFGFLRNPDFIIAKHRELYGD